MPNSGVRRYAAALQSLVSAGARDRLARAEEPVVRRLSPGGKWIRTIGPPPEIVVDPSGSRRDHRAKYGCLSARPSVRCFWPPGKTQHLLPKLVFDRPGFDRWNLASATFADAGPIDAMGRAARDGNFVAVSNRWR